MVLVWVNKLAYEHFVVGYWSHHVFGNFIEKLNSVTQIGYWFFITVTRNKRFEVFFIGFMSL